MFMEFTIFDETLEMFPVSYRSFSFCPSLSLSLSLILSLFPSKSSELPRHTQKESSDFVNGERWM